MNRLVVTRDFPGDTDEFGTFGVATFGQLVFDSLELPWRDNQPDISCVPIGVYDASVIMSPHFHRLVYLLRGIPGRSDVEIHVANFAGDTSKGWYSELRGCLALGLGRGVLETPKDKMQRGILHSGDAINKFMDAAAGLDIEVEFTQRAALALAA